MFKVERVEGSGSSVLVQGRGCSGLRGLRVSSVKGVDGQGRIASMEPLVVMFHCSGFQRF
jgi:hypothetical protein